ncbi:hypothetical protein [Sphingomonas sp.]|uniref:hypothetical protein n=1 Tax=Sphingomonas sp. TaxID=28214 RepID=UPI002E36612C|nr:hypothetical protein [Sphingomonas sp.]HEX4695446.1 hypothetical protein [Sphingomonas sp.]
MPIFFGLRVASALLLLKLSASYLPVHGFTVFAQLMAFSALLNLIAIGGTQNGVIRQAAAASDAGALARVYGAALAIWAAAVPLIGLPVAIGSRAISSLLVDTSRAWVVVISIAAFALFAGPGQIWCSLLSGRRHPTQSLSAQAAGLVAGTAAAAWFIAHGEAARAALCFAAGPLATMAVALPMVRLFGIALLARPARAEMRALLHYSAAIAATTGFAAVTLFGLRSIYRDSFGATMLGYWMAANRISDLSTQFLGLFLLQFYVPHLATVTDAAARRRLILRCAGVGAGAMGLVILSFSLLSGPLVHLFLSRAYLPAVPFIRAYMIGDLMRVFVSLAMFTAFAKGRPARYAAIEIGTLAMMAVIALVLIHAGDPRAPQFSYAGAYALSAVLAAALFFWRGDHGLTASSTVATP